MTRILKMPENRTTASRQDLAHKRFGLLLLVLVALCAPAAQAQTYAITGAKIHTLTGPPIPSGTVVIRDGKVAAVGANVPVPSGAQVINARGLEVYPGFFDAVTNLGLTEVGQGAPGTVDTAELGDYNPQVVAATAVHPASEHIPVARANGVTHALSVPGLGGGGGGGGGGGPVMGGQASAIHTDGWVIDEMLLRRSAALLINWPTYRGGTTFDPATFQTRRRPFSEVRQEYERRIRELESWIERARHYAQAVEKGSPENFQRDLKLEALVPFVKGQMPALVVAQTDRDIRNAVEWFEKHKLKLVIAGGRDAWKVKDFLKQKGVGVILGPSQALPAAEDEPYDKPLSRAGELHAAGVKVAFATFSSSNVRTLPYEAANAVPYGLPWEEALKAITLYPAQLLGLADQIGTIESGKLANLLIANGDPLEIRTEIRYVFVRGKLASLDNKHKQLYEKYRARP
jgi:imidazolonepropionase-like amidohydrolase